MLTTYADYSRITRNMESSLQLISSDPVVARDTAYYRDNISSVRNPSEFINDDRILRYALHAFGLGDMAYAKGLIRALLESDLNDPRSLARSVTDTRLKDFSEAFNFGQYGEFTTSRPATTSTVVAKNIRQTLEVQSGSNNDGVRLALYFGRRVVDITDPYQLIADAALFNVVKVAFGLPDIIAAMPIDRLAGMLESRIDFSRLPDPAYSDSILRRYSALNDAKKIENTSLTTLSNSANGVHTLSLELMLQITQIRLRAP